jgi:hypothetical protein
MSSGSDRDRPAGVIRQGSKVVGSICMPEASEVFIKEFNHCYGQLRMEVEDNPKSDPIRNPNPHTFRLPSWFRHVWNQRDREST